MGFTLLPLNQTVTDISESKFRPQLAFHCFCKSIYWLLLAEWSEFFFHLQHAFSLSAFVCIFYFWVEKNSLLENLTPFQHACKWEMKLYDNFWILNTLNNFGNN